MSEEGEGAMVHFPGFFRSPILVFPAMHLTLLVPELLWPEPDDHPALAATACPALENLLSRGQFTRSAAQTAEATLYALFGHDTATLPGALRRRGENDAPDVGDERWLCADPVHLRLHDERLILADSTQFDVSLDEAQQLVAALNAELPEIGDFHAASAERWYLRLRKDSALPPFEAPPLSGVSGHHVGQLLPDILDDRDWRRHFNAIQTVLHAHPLNQQRAAEGRMTLNSLWLWGDGPMPAERRSPFDAVWSNQALAHGLARAAGMTPHPQPDGFAAVLAGIGASTHPLVVIDDLLAPACYDDGNHWISVLAALEAAWFVPLRQALASGTLHQLHLVASTTHGLLGWTCRRSDRWKFWQRPAALATVTTQLARSAKEKA